MKKKILTFILSICLIVPAMFCLTACDSTEKGTITEIVVLDQINLNKVYDGKPVEEPFIYSIIGEDKFSYSVDWYQGDTKLEQNPINAGNYKLTITINYGEKTETLEKEFKIERCKVKVPKLRHLTYNGEEQDILDYSVIEISKTHDGIDREYIKLTTEHGLVEKDCNRGLYLVVEFESAEIGASVKTSFVAHKKDGVYTPINITNSSGVVYHYMYDVQYEVTGKII